VPQIQIDQQPVTQITIIEAEPEKQAEALSLMRERARFMKRQPGFISISLHRSLDGRRIVNYIQWERLRTSHLNFAKPGASSEGSPTTSILIYTRSPKPSLTGREPTLEEREGETPELMRPAPLLVEPESHGAVRRS
jgi:hypothetical protein